MNCNNTLTCFVIIISLEKELQADLATERERQVTTALANQTTGLTNGRVANCAQDVAFSRAFPSSTDVPVLLLNQPNNSSRTPSLHNQDCSLQESHNAAQHELIAH